MALWGGRFSESTNETFRQFNDSLRFDYRLLQQDLTASIAWSVGLEKAGVISLEEQQRLAKALKTIGERYQNKSTEIIASGEEDIHSWVEAQLIAELGDLGKKLHTGRSRNDQVATDLRLYCKAVIDDIEQQITSLLHSIASFAKKNTKVVFPGYTHLQRAQPISVAHWALAYAEMLKRDLQRLQQAKSMADACPLGSAALAGTTFPIDRFMLAEQLNFSAPTANSIDAVSDRDFVFDLLYAASVNMVHLSRLAEDTIFYVSSECGFFSLADSLSTGSSLMPQKKNPDALEIVRGKVGRAIGHLNALLITMKGLPTAYNKDLQEDKEALFDTIDFWQIALVVLADLVKSLKVNEQKCLQAISDGFLNATDVADYLVKKGVSFRDAHHICGQIVQYAEAKNTTIESLSLKELQQFSGKLGPDLYATIDPASIIEQRNVYGGTALLQIENALSELDILIQTHRGRLPVEVVPATVDDIDGIEALINYWAVKGENLPRTRQDIVEQIQDFLVVKENETIIGCGSLYVYHDDLAEIRSLGVSSEQQSKGIGRELVLGFMERARELKVKRLFVLTRVPQFFTRCGFIHSDKNDLPEKVHKDCQMCPKLHACDEIALVFEPDLEPAPRLVSVSNLS